MVFKKGDIPWNKSVPRLEQLKHKKKNYCLDCGKEINKWSKRCMPCNNKLTGLKHRGEKHPNYRKDRPTCQMCGKLISSRNCKLCRECYVANCGGINHYNFGKQRSEETKNKLSKANKGKKPNKELKKKRAEAVKKAKYQYLVENISYLSFLYLEKENSTEYIGKLFNCSRWTTLGWLKRLNIPVRSQTKVAKLRARRGKNNNLYIDGRTSLSSSIRDLSEYHIWRTAVFERDNYTCQECGQHGGKLEAHHIKPFAVVLNKFLIQYSRFSLYEDKETLVRLAMDYAEFFKITNGKTLCKACHKLTDSYLNNNIKKVRS